MKSIFATLCLVWLSIAKASSASVGTFIEGGIQAQPGQFPYIVAISTGTQQILTGVLLNSRTVLTSARNVYQQSTLEIILGANSPNLPEPEQKRVQVTAAAITIHPEFDPAFRPSRDVALIDLGTPVELTARIQPAPLLPRQALDDDFARSNGTVIGWNATRSGIVYVTDYIPLNVQCVFTAYTYHVCMYGKFDVGPWQSDSGAPLISQYNGRAVLIGVLSYTGEKGPEFGEGGVYSRLSYFADWIEANSNVRFV